jgi:hypothetical protein
MDEIERNEIHNLLKKHKCLQDGYTIMDNTMRTGRLNKRSLARNGVKEQAIEKMIIKLQKALKDYE